LGVEPEPHLQPPALKLQLVRLLQLALLPFLQVLSLQEQVLLLLPPLIQETCRVDDE
jgi:hypothetical protein